MAESAAAFRAARRQLLDWREDYDRAYKTFQWPALDQFNWALDWFDDYARNNQDIALWLVDAGGGEHRISFAEMAARPNQVANFLRAQGVGRGDALLVMLDNVAALWETMLAAIKAPTGLVRATFQAARSC